MKILGSVIRTLVLSTLALVALINSQKPNDKALETQLTPQKNTVVVHHSR